MVDGPSGAAGGGNPPNDAANAGQAGNAGAAGAGAENGGGGAPPSGAAAGAAGAAALDRSKLSPVLQALDEQQLNEAFDAMFQAARAGGDHVRRTEDTRPVEPTPAPALPTAEEIRERFDPNSDKFDPMSVIQQYTEAQYGPLLTGIAGRTTANMIANFRQQIPDFADFEGDVLRVLQGVDPRTLSTEQVVGAYYAAKGARITQREIEDRKKKPTTLEPTPSHTDKEPAVKLTAEEKTAAQKLFRHAADPEAAYIKSQSLMTDFEVKVPLGGGKHG